MSKLPPGVPWLSLRSRPSSDSKAIERDALGSRSLASIQWAGSTTYELVVYAKIPDHEVLNKAHSFGIGP